MLNISQTGLAKRVLVSLPLFLLGLFIIFALPFQTIWSYFAWMNQTLAAITLWCITLYLTKHDKPVMIGLLPALFMTYTCSSYIFVSPMMAGMENRVLAYTLGVILTVTIGVAILFQSRRSGE
jgi:carbon starvation protein CstA